MRGALENTLVLDLSRLLPGPYCSMILADHGARVIAIEDRRFEKEGLSILSGINRNKEHMTLNLKHDSGRAVFYELVERADVVLEGFRPGVTARLAIDYESLRKVNRSLIYCSLTGYGQTGPLRDRAGHDINFAGYGGALSLIGPADGAPIIPGVQLGDIAGGMNAAIGILMALYARERAGEGRYIDISMTDSVTAMLPIPAGIRWVEGRPPERGRSWLSHKYAYYNIYETRDGRYLTVGALEPRFWERICNHFQRPDFIPLQHEDGRQPEMIAFLKEAFRQKDRNEWLAIFDELDACVGAVSGVDEILDDPASIERGLVHEIRDDSGAVIRVLGNAVRLDGAAGAALTPPPKFGAHTRAILAELDYTDAEIDELTAEGAL